MAHILGEKIHFNAPVINLFSNVVAQRTMKISLVTRVRARVEKRRKPRMIYRDWLFRAFIANISPRKSGSGRYSLTVILLRSRRPIIFPYSSSKARIVGWSTDSPIEHVDSTLEGKGRDRERWSGTRGVENQACVSCGRSIIHGFITVNRPRLMFPCMECFGNVALIVQ